MRKLQRHIPAVLTTGAVLCGIGAIVFFVVGIWTPQWQVAHDHDGQGFSGCHDACWIYQANHQWFATGWVALFVAVLFGIGRVVMWRIDEDNNHGH